MKITIEVPDSTMVVTYQYVYDDEATPHLKIKQETLDTNKLNELREVAHENA